MTRNSRLVYIFAFNTLYSLRSDCYTRSVALSCAAYKAHTLWKILSGLGARGERSSFFSPKKKKLHTRCHCSSIPYKWARIQQDDDSTVKHPTSELGTMFLYTFFLSLDFGKRHLFLADALTFLPHSLDFRAMWQGKQFNFQADYFQLSLTFRLSSEIPVIRSSDVWSKNNFVEQSHELFK